MESKSSQKQKQSDLVTAYLVAYNGCQFFGWLILTYKLIFYLCVNGTHKGLYADVQPILDIFQTAAILEVVNAATGMVRSNTFLTGFQVASRVLLTWHVHYIADVHDSYGPVCFLFAWGVTEVIRYLFYLLSLMGHQPYVLQWFRYTFFYVLYPMGVTGELLSLYLGLEYVKSTQMFSIGLPNAANFAFSYYYALFIIMATYVPIFPQLYMHMIVQRKKVIGGAKKKTE